MIRNIHEPQWTQTHTTSRRTRHVFCDDSKHSESLPFFLFRLPGLSSPSTFGFSYWSEIFVGICGSTEITEYNRSNHTLYKV
ncbi:hypothetical protein HanPSC8_Chr12g0511301 [Helianthus annuus]|nr:hypothetical protein HanPSC8_Chr12g0511301 [Helianthus annuus]